LAFTKDFAEQNISWDIAMSLLSFELLFMLLGILFAVTIFGRYLKWIKPKASKRVQAEKE
jgi:hypothetical protein